MTRHNLECRRVFKNYDPECPRCQELAAGAAPREGWGSRALRQDEQRRRHMAAHFAPGGPHARGECGPVCTAFDY